MSMTRADADPSAIWNFRLLSHHELNGFGGMGEGLSIQIAKDGRRILWSAHESAPKNFTGIDVTDPRALKVVVQTSLPQQHMRSNSLEVVGDTMVVAYQTQQVGQQPAGFEIFDISRPEEPRSVAFFDASGPHSRGVHQLWFCDGEYVHMAAGAADFQPRNPKDHQCYRTVDIRDPTRPREVGRWWLPGTREGDAAPPPERHGGRWDSGFRAHNTNVYPQRPDRAYLGYLDAGMIVLDIADKANPKVVSRWDNSPPYYGFTHTVLPLFERDLLVVTDESTVDGGADWPKMIWMVDNRDETRPVPISTCPMPDVAAYAKRGGRCGAHNLHENVPLPTSWFSDQVVIGTFFNGGLRAFDISDPYRPSEIAHFVPAAPRNAPTGAIQINDVFVDERGIVYTVDRHLGGLYVLEMDF
ncbi:LVIVD repeat-containing protein [Roseomonas sp. BN140053]|uniref:LVIVD repeat-containing protein n=1 Tax=Roseomonas sp. BN140053 TaxID=3391898 RepID=UPI0039E8472A